MNLEKIRELSKKYDTDHQTASAALTPRFKALVEKYGVSAVSAATDLKESTVTQYARCKEVPVSEYAVKKAETILPSL